ncbi:MULTISPECIES: 1-phosphofructokinase family hexose kinase [Heyndrickxia]|uniref:1-phosphofructokinase family hexose kinase n=1 Tax=Heyndrickxia TaxID=2837504 RepID=UPI002E216672|nr:1-phosphofructokinase family hexose kinase [Heyndrickxia coagulans]
MIYTITLNPAIDRVIHINGELTRGRNNTVSNTAFDIGGKGTHISVVLSALGQPNIAAGMVGENRKDELIALLREKQVESAFYVVSGQTVRENFVITDDSQKGSYMITHAGPVLKKEDLEGFANDFIKRCNPGDIVAVAGNPPKTTRPEDYEWVLRKIKETGVQLVVDASGPYLKAAIQAEPDLIKPNQFEFAELMQLEINSIEDCIAAYQKTELSKIPYFIVSFGKNGSLLFYNNLVYKVTPPDVHTVNDTGCGDAFVGGLVYGMSCRYDVQKMLKFATAVSASKSMQATSSGFDIKEAGNIEQNVKFENIEKSGRNCYVI